MSSHSSPSFTHKEDVAIWKFVIEKLDESRRTDMWDEFRRKTGILRNSPDIHKQFVKFLLPGLIYTKFHVETKLRICYKYRVSISECFLKELRRAARVDIGEEDRCIISFQVNPDVPQNKDIHCEDFETMMPTRFRDFTKEEENEIWKYAIENCEQYSHLGNKRFWQGLHTKLNSTRELYEFPEHFHRMTKKLHETDIDVEDQLKLFKHFDIAVDVRYVKRLKSYANIKTKGGCIISYELLENRPEKRKISLESSNLSAKRPRTVEEEEEIVYDGTIPGGFHNPDMIIKVAKTEEDGCDENESDQADLIVDKVKREEVQPKTEELDPACQHYGYRYEELSAQQNLENLDPAADGPRYHGEADSDEDDRMDEDYEEDQEYKMEVLDTIKIIKKPNVKMENVRNDMLEDDKNGYFDLHASEDQAGPGEDNVKVEEVQQELVEPKSEFDGTLNKVLETSKSSNTPNEKKNQKMVKTVKVLDQANKPYEEKVEKMENMEERIIEWMQNNTKEQDKKMEEMNQKQTDRMVELMQNNAKEQAKATEAVNKKQTNRLEEVVRNGMQEMKATVSEQNMAGMAGIAALNTKMEVLRREVRNEEAAFLELIRSVYSTESPELDATVKRIEELIPMISEEKRNIMLLNICTTVKSLMEMTLL